MSQPAPRLCLLSHSQVRALVPLSKTQIHRMINAGEFPKPITIGRNRVAFLESEVYAWIEERARLREEGAEERRERAKRVVGGRR